MRGIHTRSAALPPPGRADGVEGALHWGEHPSLEAQQQKPWPLAFLVGGWSPAGVQVGAEQTLEDVASWVSPPPRCP